MHIRSYKLDGFIKIYGKIRYLVLFDCGWFDKIYNNIKHLISKKSVLQIVLIIIWQEPELIYMILNLLKNY